MKASAASSRAITGRISLSRRLLESSAAVRSMGLVVVAKDGSSLFSESRVSGLSVAISRPAKVAASAAITQVAPEPEMATSRRPFGFQPLR